MWALLAALLGSPSPAIDGPIPAIEPPAQSRWLGYQEVTGSKVVPLIGTLTTRNRSWFVAERRATPSGFVLTQRPCHVDFDRVMGVKVAVAPALLRHMPPSVARFERLADGTFGARGWRSGWDAADIDRDGHPGATVTVEAPMCGGKLFVASTSTTKARAKPHNGGIDGRVQVTVEQHILGADGACLEATAEDSTEQHAGWFRLVPAPEGATCADFDRRTWPAAPGR